MVQNMCPLGVFVAHLYCFLVVTHKLVKIPIVVATLLAAARDEIRVVFSIVLLRLVDLVLTI